MGALIMAHSDDNGLVLPPKLAPIQVVIVPIYRKAEELDQISAKIEPIVAKLKAKGISVKFDDSDNRKPGWKFAEYELKGVPVRLAMGARDMENGTIELARRDTLTKETLPVEGIEEVIENLMSEIQDSIYQKAFDFRIEKTTKVDTYDEFKELWKVKLVSFLLIGMELQKQKRKSKQKPRQQSVVFHLMQKRKKAFVCIVGNHLCEE